MKKLFLILLCSICLGVSPTINNFNGGQASSHMEPRTDFQKYQTLNRTMENMFPTIHGPAARRSGTYFVADSPTQRIGNDPGLAQTTAISTLEELQKMGSFFATFDSGTDTMGNEIVTTTGGRMGFISFITYNTSTTGTVWWVWPAFSGNLTNGDTLTGQTSGATIALNSSVTSNLTGNYYLINDIDASVTSTWYGGAGFISIGYGRTINSAFTGTLDGHGFTISNLFVDGTLSELVFFMTGLFAQTNGATLYNFNITDADMTTDFGFSGLFVGIPADTICQGISVQGSLTTTTSQCGGFCGGNSAGSTFEWCSSDVTMDIAGSVWCGLFSGTVNGDYTDCFASGTISGTGNFDVGGFIGIATSISSFTRCSANGTIPGQQKGSEHTNGGIAGTMSSESVYVDSFYNPTMNVLPFGGEDEVQRILPDSGGVAGGHYHIVFDGLTSDAISHDATEAQTQTACDSVFGASVLEIEGAFPISGNRFQRINFRDRYSRINVASATIDATAITGSGSPYTYDVTVDNEAVYPSFTTQPSKGVKSNPLINEVVRIIPFEISTDDSFVIEAGNSYFRFYKEGS